jgi:hypothetical protein
MIEILLIGLVLVVTVTLAFVVWLAVRQFDAQRKEWAAERSKLLDRVQRQYTYLFRAAGFMEPPEGNGREHSGIIPA